MPETVKLEPFQDILGDIVSVKKKKLINLGFSLDKGHFITDYVEWKMSDFFNTEAITEDFISFKGFDINTRYSRRKAISWLERASGNDMFFSPPQGWSEAELEIDNFIGEMRREVKLDYLKGVE